MSDENVLNRMYAGGDIADNIGHEIINLFKADNGNNYIYVNHLGTMAKAHNNKIKSILLVRYYGKNRMEILAKATGLEQISYLKSTHEKDCSSIRDEQVDYIDENNVYYNRVKLYDIFKDNKNNEKAVYITFRAKVLLKPSKPIFITDFPENNDENNLKDYRFSKQSLKMYISEHENPISFVELERIMDDVSLWEDTNSTKKVDSDINISEKKIPFLEIIGKEYDETVISNLLAYFFNLNKQAFYKFSKDVLKVKNIQENFSVKREQPCLGNNKKISGYIDLFVTDGTTAIVIENKIKSSISGMNKHQSSEDSKVSSQLTRYYDYVNKEFPSPQKKFFIFAPNYNHLNTTKHNCPKEYIIIKYSKLFDWFKDNKYLYKNNKYLEEFLYVLEKHSKPVDSSLEEEMHKKFSQAINLIENSR